MASTFRMADSTISYIVYEVCQAIWDKLVEKHMPEPTTEHLLKTAQGFWDKVGFPHCIGAIDGTHVKLECPSSTGSMYYNYMGYYSVVLQAVADVRLKFLTIHAGGYGKQSDGGTFGESNLHKLIEEGRFNMPPDAPLPGTSAPAVPFALVGDEAYPLKSYLVTPFPANRATEEQQVFNHRMSSGRCHVECAFGKLKQAYRCLDTTLKIHPDKVTLLIMTACLLQNIVIDLESPEEPSPPAPSLPNPLLPRLPEAANTRETMKEFYLRQVDSSPAAQFHRYI